MSPWPHNPALRVLCALWASPGILLGFVAAWLLLPVTWGRPRWVDGALEAKATGPLGVWLSSSGWAAFTFGATIFYWSTDAWLDKETRRHERVHVRQHLALSALMLPTYLLLLAMDGYARNAFEVAARRPE